MPPHKNTSTSQRHPPSYLIFLLFPLYFCGISNTIYPERAVLVIQLLTSLQKPYYRLSIQCPPPTPHHKNTPSSHICLPPHPILLFFLLYFCGTIRYALDVSSSLSEWWHHIKNPIIVYLLIDSPPPHPPTQNHTPKPEIPATVSHIIIIIIIFV